MPPTAIIYDTEGNIAMIVHPDNEAQLDDPAFNPKGCTQVRIPKETYDICKTDIDIKVATVPFIKEQKLADTIQVFVDSADNVVLQ